ncbi:head-tail connector protein [Aeromonas caviae]|uniref:head-tail connector protein n=1 Tax=Aeromonas caviae TaxID=648 RepID=UPI002DD6555C|nr:head-tail connector protein [Aeromonas caviae]
MIEYKILDRNPDSYFEELIDDLIAQHCILIDVEPELLEMYKLAALEEAERYCNRAICETTIQISSYYRTFRLPYGCTTVTSEPVDSEGQLCDNWFNPVTGVMTIRGNPVFPVFLTAKSNGVISDSLKTAIAMIIATKYQNRESVVVGASVSELPYNHNRILDLYRMPPVTTGRN